MTAFAVIGCGFVADLYMRSFQTFPNIDVVRVHDKDPARLSAFADFWKLHPAETLDSFFEALQPGTIILNLTNPAAHFEVTKACLDHGHHVYTEKPMAIAMDKAEALFHLAAEKGLEIATAPCSVLGETAQLLGRAVRQNLAGTPRLVYAELDDVFIPQAPYRDWQSESGAPWPYEDEFRVGCTLEHAGYYLSWLIAIFGPVREVVAAAAELVPEKLDGPDRAPDFTTATLYFESGPVVRLTCSIIAPHDHGLQVIGDAGVLRVGRAWDNAAPVRFHPRRTIRRRLIDMPFGRRVRARGRTHPKVKRWGAAAMNFALGPMEMAEAIAANRTPRLAGPYALHLNEVTLAIQEAHRHPGARAISTRCTAMEPMPWAA